MLYKKSLLKSISCALSAALCISCSAALFPALSASDLVISQLNYTESTDYDPGSCDSGYTSCPWINAAPGKNWSTNITRYSLLLICIGEYSSAMNDSASDYEFDEVFFTSLRNTLESARTNGTTVGLRFRYDAEGASNPEPADFSMVLRHIEQIGESNLLTEYEDVISFVETGFVGCWGEQWGGKYTSLEHKAQVLDAFLNITPDTVPVTVRTPNTFRQWLSDYCGVSTTAQDMTYSIDDPVLATKAARVGLYNDGYMGSDSDLGTYSNRKGETQWLNSAPSYGGEFSGNDEWRLKYTTWQPENALPEMYYTNLLRINSNLYRTRTVSSTYTTQEDAQARLDEIDALYKNCGLGDYDFAGSITQEEDGSYKASWKWMGYDDFTFDEELDSKLGVDCDNSAFYGQNVWQFIRAHLGYRFVLRSSALSADCVPGGNLSMKFSVENTGFSETPKNKEVEVILSNGEINYTYTTDINARNWASATLNNENVNVKLPENMPGGKWDVYLRISEINSDALYDSLFCTKFANEELQYNSVLNANYMGCISVDAPEDLAKEVFDDSRASGLYMDCNPIYLDESSAVSLIDKSYTFAEDNHYGFTLIYKIDGITEPIQIGNWYAGFTVSEGGYSSAYTTYGINTRNQEISENGYYALHIPFYGCAFNCQEASVAGVTQLTALTINDSRNYWSEDTFTELGNNTNATITPIAVVEGGYQNYNVTYHLENGDYTYTGTYGFEDKLSQTIKNVSASPVLSLLDTECPEQITDENGNICSLVGFTTKKDDKSCIIDENFVAMGDVDLYPYYELDRNITDLNLNCTNLVNGTDESGVRYILDETTMTASVGDGSVWENNSGYASNGSVIIPAYVITDGKKYTVTSVESNAFGSDINLTDITLPSTISSIGENAFYYGTEIIVYENSTPAEILENSEFTVTLIEKSALSGDVNSDGSVDNADIIALRDWLMGIEVSINGAAADMDTNGYVDSLDLMLLRNAITE